MFSVDDPVVSLGAALADPAVVHPAYRFALLALSADSEVPCIFEQARCGGTGFGFGRGRWKVASINPGRNGRVRSVPVDLADEDVYSIVGPLDADELIEKLAVTHAHGFLLGSR